MSSHHSPCSIRILKKQCVALAKEGYHVYYVVPGSGEEEIDGVNLRYVRKKAGFLGRVFINPLRTYIASKRINADLYHFHDPELMFFGFLLKLSGNKVVYDVHENLPAKCADAGLKKIFLLGPFFVWLIDRLEKFFAGRFDFNITVNQDIADRLPAFKTIIITNYPILSLIHFTKYKQANDPPVIIYAGLLNRIRGIKELVAAMAFVKNKASLVLLGTWQDDAYKNECLQLESWTYCFYGGNVPLEVAYKIMDSSDIGIVNFMPLDNHLYSMPNKAFEYMAFGLPTIMSDFPFWRAKFADCALFVDPQNPKNIASAIIELAVNPSLRQNLGLQGRQFVENSYSWEAESKKLISTYRKLLKPLEKN